MILDMDMMMAELMLMEGQDRTGGERNAGIYVSRCEIIMRGRFL